MTDWDTEMQKALEADGEKLRQLTGEDHGPWPRLPSNAVDWQFQREDALIDVTIHYDIEPYVPAKISGPPEDCYPAEGGCVTDMVAMKPGTNEIVELSEEEAKEVTDWIEQTHDHDADRQGDPDSAYDAWRDEQWDRQDEPQGWDD